MAETLVIYAHPGRKGHNAFTLAKVEEWLQEQGKDYELLDLYAEVYDPVLPVREHFVSGKPSLAAETKRYQEKVAEAKWLIFIYPVWWSGPPAILKGFFDRVFSARFAFRYEKLPFPVLGMKARPVGLLKDKRAVVFYTSGATRWAQRLILINSYTRTIKRFVLAFCGVRTKVYAVGGASEPLCPRRERRIERNVRRGLRWLF